MAYLGTFNANDIEPADRSALPAGDYPVLISGSEWKDSKSGAQYLALTLQVIDGPCKGRYLWHNLNLNNANAMAVEIAQRELSAICRATGQMTISDSEQLHNIPMIVKVAYIPPKDGYDEKNAIKAFKPASSVSSPAAAAFKAPAPAAQAARTPPASATKAAPPKAPPAAPTPAPSAGPVAGKPWERKPPVADVPAEEIPF